MCWHACMYEAVMVRSAISAYWHKCNIAKVESSQATAAAATLLGYERKKREKNKKGKG